MRAGRTLLDGWTNIFDETVKRYEKDRSDVVFRQQHVLKNQQNKSESINGPLTPEQVTRYNKQYQEIEDEKVAKVKEFETSLGKRLARTAKESDNIFLDKDKIPKKWSEYQAMRKAPEGFVRLKLSHEETEALYDKLWSST